MSSKGRRAEVHGHSGWLIPLAFGFVILLLSGLFLGWYLRPGPRGGGAPTVRSNLVQLSVRGKAFAIPANYIETAAARGGGEQDSLSLVAIFPSFQGYSDADARQFAGNAPDSPVVRLALRGDPTTLDAGARLKRIYLPYVVDPKGAEGPFELTQYTFRSDSGYQRNDLFVGTRDGKPVLLLCEKEGAQLTSPNCLAVDRPMAGNLSLSWRFKRAWLSHWREIAAGVDTLVKRFEVKA